MTPEISHGSLLTAKFKTRVLLHICDVVEKWLKLRSLNSLSGTSRDNRDGLGVTAMHGSLRGFFAGKIRANSRGGSKMVLLINYFAGMTCVISCTPNLILQIFGRGDKIKSAGVPKINRSRTPMTIAHQITLALVFNNYFLSTVLTIQSGNTACAWSWTTLERAVGNHRDFAEFLGCPSNNSQAMVDCMRQIDQEKLRRRQSMVTKTNDCLHVVDRYIPINIVLIHHVLQFVTCPIK